ncbi:MAG: hypothetical protein HC788_13765 [Sphingopyxis sp.]|nr:hypothetical protein [Sphingopyxis sp.]
MRAERRYARSFLRELAALVAVVAAGWLLALFTGWAENSWLVVLPVAMLMLVLLGTGRQPRAGSSSTP